MKPLTTSTFEIDNLKCGGCANTIIKTLNNIPGLSNPKVDVENGTIRFENDSSFDVQSVKDKLASIGYPVKGSVAGLEKMVGVAKSYVSCAIGKMSN